MDEDDPVRFALLRVGRRDEERDPQARGGRKRRERCETRGSSGPPADKSSAAMRSETSR
jgi:hypothetical protein